MNLFFQNYPCFNRQNSFPSFLCSSLLPSISLSIDFPINCAINGFPISINCSSFAGLRGSPYLYQEKHRRRRSPTLFQIGFFSHWKKKDTHNFASIDFECLSLSLNFESGF